MFIQRKRKLYPLSHFFLNQEMSKINIFETLDSEARKRNKRNQWIRKLKTTRLLSKVKSLFFAETLKEMFDNSHQRETILRTRMKH